MKLLLTLFIATILIAQSIPKTALESINETDLKKHLSFIASDEMRGRDTGSPELKIVARYLASHLESYGYKGLGENGSFFQPVPLYKTQFVNSSLKVMYDDKLLNFENGKDLAVYGFGDQTIDLELDLVSVSRGLDVDTYHDYLKDDVNGKAVVRFDLTGELAEKAKTDQNYSHQQIRNRLRSNGAKLVIIVIEDEARADQLIPSYFGFTNQSNMTINKSNDDSFAYMLIKRKVLDALLEADEEDDFDQTKKYEFSSKIKFNLNSASEIVKSQNVVAYLEGTDPELKKEYVGFGAHYDHVGVDGNKIFNGADDDGSGTVSVLTIAEQMAKNPSKRSIFIIFHTGEEKGLFGSEYYNENPLIPIKDMVTVLNMDMVGSYYLPEKVHIIGADRISQELHDINVMVNKETVNMDLDYTYNAKNHPERLYFRSDHYNYAKKGIPIIFYTNDNPDHYHKETDTVETINFTKMKRITQLALATGYHVANKKERLKINPTSTASN